MNNLKKILTILIIFLAIVLQTGYSQDSVSCIPKKQVIKIVNQLKAGDAYKQSDSIKTNKIDSLYKVISDKDTIITQERKDKKILSELDDNNQFIIFKGETLINNLNKDLKKQKRMTTFSQICVVVLAIIAIIK